MIIYGLNPVRLALEQTPERVLELCVMGGGRRIDEIMSLAAGAGIKASSMDRSALTELAGSDAHQGAVARLKPFRHTPFDELLQVVAREGRGGLVVVLDHITDPQNLGAIARSAGFFGATGLVIPKDRASGITPAAVKASAGALLTLSVSVVTNVRSAIEALKGADLWVVGADVAGESAMHELDLTGVPLALVIGSEGKGLARLVRESCDMLGTIKGAGESLNASVAAGIALYEINRQRSGIRL